ncbi:MAG TPA: diguanylate cyclase, partial [Chthonomonadaceae bacterium]|nr:diguanylate cyclase [Chthonomonadaceae bacterium]
HLSVLNIGADDGKMVRFLGAEGAALIGRAIGRYLRQETRAHDVVGRCKDVDRDSIPTFLIVALLMNEEQVAPIAERLREAMMAHAGGESEPALNFSIGIATMSVDASEPAELIARAAAALRQARLAGGGQVWRHSDSVRRIFERQSQELRDEE